MMFLPGGVQADVLTIAVARAYWGRGIGSALLGALLQAAIGRGCTEVFLEVREDNPRARGLYLRRGFEEIGVRRGYYQPSGVNAIVMRKDLRR
jgi:ribosomal-protein-alanine acetyltransferase